jgi:hypothetical protein
MPLTFAAATQSVKNLVAHVVPQAYGREHGSYATVFDDMLRAACLIVLGGNLKREWVRDCDARPFSGRGERRPFKITQTGGAIV